MIVGYARGNQLHRQIYELDTYGIDELFHDSSKAQDIMGNETSDFQQLMIYVQAGDTIVLPSLSTISRDYAQLLRFTEELNAQEVELVVLNLSFSSTYELRKMLSWVARNDRFLHPRLFHIAKKNEAEGSNYSLISRDTEVKQLYRNIAGMLLRKEKLKAIAAKNSVPVETVFRIKKEMDKIKLCLFLVVVFFATVAGIKIAEQLTDHFLLQLLICLVAAILIVYNTLADSDVE